MNIHIVDILYRYQNTNLYVFAGSQKLKFHLRYRAFKICPTIHQPLAFFFNDYTVARLKAIRVKPQILFFAHNLNTYKVFKFSFTFFTCRQNKLITCRTVN